MIKEALQNISYLMFAIGAAGVGGDDMLKAGLICLVGLAVLGVSVFLEGRRNRCREQHTMQKNLRNYSDVQSVKRMRISA